MKTEQLVSICDGRITPLRMVKDTIFSQRLTGDGVGLIPESGDFVAPCDGTVKLIFKGNHAMVIEKEDGVNIMIHIGLNTVSLNGQGFTGHVTRGQEVKTGDLLVEVDMNFMQEHRVDLTSVVLIMDPKTVRNLECHEYGSAQKGKTKIIEYTV